MTVSHHPHASWRILSSSMKESRISPAAVVVMRRDSTLNTTSTTKSPPPRRQDNDKEEIWVVGGYVGFATTPTCEVLSTFSSSAKAGVAAAASSWRTIKPQLIEARAGCAAVMVGHNQTMYAIGGYGSDSCELLHLHNTQEEKEMKWHLLLSRMQERRGGCAAVVVDDDKHILVFGGSNESQKLSSVEVLNVVHQRWIHPHDHLHHDAKLIPPPMPTARAYHAAVRLKHCVYLVGGEDDTNTLVAQVDVLDLRTNTWSTTIQDMPTPRKYCAAVAVSDTQFVVAGGRDQDHVYSCVHLFDSQQQQRQWSSWPTLRHARSACALVKAGSALYAIGGKGADLQSDPTVESLPIL